MQLSAIAIEVTTALPLQKLCKLRKLQGDPQSSVVDLLFGRMSYLVSLLEVKYSSKIEATDLILGQDLDAATP